MKEKFYLGFEDSENNVVVYAIASEELAKAFDKFIWYDMDEQGAWYAPESKLDEEVNNGGVYVSETMLNIPEGTTLKEAIDSYGLFEAWRDAEEKCWEIFD